VDKAAAPACQGFADAGQKPPALDRPKPLPSGTKIRAKGLSERPVALERIN
jgi:hypothetical protein